MHLDASDMSQTNINSVIQISEGWPVIWGWINARMKFWFRFLQWQWHGGLWGENGFHALFMIKFIIMVIVLQFAWEYSSPRAPIAPPPPPCTPPPPRTTASGIILFRWLIWLRFHMLPVKKLEPTAWLGHFLKWPPVENEHSNILVIGARGL